MRMERETNVFTVLAINPAFVPFLIDETVTVDTSTHQMTRTLLYTLYIVHHALASHRQKRSDMFIILYTYRICDRKIPNHLAIERMLQWIVDWMKRVLRRKFTKYALISITSSTLTMLRYALLIYDVVYYVYVFV